MAGVEGADMESIPVDFLNFLMDLPFRSFLDFQEDTLSRPADELISSLLEKVHGKQE
jgi:hypothetical protein